MHKNYFVANLCPGNQKKNNNKGTMLGSSCKISIFLSEFNRMWSSLTYFIKVPKIKVQGIPTRGSRTDARGRTDSWRDRRL